MAIRFKDGDYFKVVGGDFGALRRGGRWEAFGCLTCARYRGLIVPSRRLQAGCSRRAEDVAHTPQRPVHGCGGAREHRAAHAAAKGDG